MTDVDFYVDALLSGLICGVGPGSTAGEIEEALGSDFVDDARKQRMRRDYGLVEFHFNRRPPTWVCVGASIQVHRLLDAVPGIIPPALIDRYGMFVASLEVGHLTDALRAKGGGNLVREETSGEFVRYRVDGTNLLVHARQVQSKSPDAGSDSEKVWSIEMREASPVMAGT